MMKTMTSITLITAMTVLILTGCSSTPKEDDGTLSAAELDAMSQDGGSGSIAGGGRYGSVTTRGIDDGDGGNSGGAGQYHSGMNGNDNAGMNGGDRGGMNGAGMNGAGMNEDDDEVINRQQFPELNDPNSPVYNKIVYFEYDAATIEPQYADLLRAHAGFLRQQPQARVLLQGHTDERGTRSYNLALGERRADAVRGFFIAEGIANERIKTLSYGEERPADVGHDERAWSLNRRVELVY